VNRKQTCHIINKSGNPYVLIKISYWDIKSHINVDCFKSLNLNFTVGPSVLQPENSRIIWEKDMFTTLAFV